MGFFPDAKGLIRIDFWIFSSENFEMLVHRTLPRCILEPQKAIQDAAGEKKKVPETMFRLRRSIHYLLIHHLRLSHDQQKNAISGDWKIGSRGP